MSDVADAWLAQVPVYSEFASLTDLQRYAPVPDDWYVGVADVVGSTAAISGGRYKAVNMVGAAVISALRNGLDRDNLPAVFGGDGVSFVVAPDQFQATADALAACRTWSSEAMELELRAGLITVGELQRLVEGSARSGPGGLRADVLLAWHAPSPHVRYAMFAGGGIGAAERALKRGDFSVPVAPSGAIPDLTGLSCRWGPIPARNGSIVSLIAEPGAAGQAAFANVSRELVALLARRLARSGHPVSEQGPEFGFTAHGIDLERRTLFGARRRFSDWVKLRAFYFLAWFLLTFRIRAGDFDPVRYREESGQNVDFQKFEDGLKLTVDCDPATFEALSNLLEKAAEAGTARFGLCQQTDALMTCIVPSPSQSDHIHFVDGAGGGYAAAAAVMKARFSA